MTSKETKGYAVLEVGLSEVLDDLVRVETRLYNEVADRLRAEVDVTAGQYEFLRFIAAHEPCRVQDVARAIAITVGATSKIVDRLVAAGWCLRRPNPADGRSSLLSVTEQGGYQLVAAATVVDAVLNEHLKSIVPAGELARFAGVLRDLRSAAEASGIGMPTG